MKSFNVTLLSKMLYCIEKDPLKIKHILLQKENSETEEELTNKRSITFV